MAHDEYSGLVSNITVPSTVNISSSTNASPIVVTTATNHGLETGDYASIVGHLVNTAANGIWPVTVLSNTTFELDGSTGNGVGAGTGTVQSLSLGVTDMVTDGNTPLAAEWTVPDACSLDRTAFLWYRMGWAPTLFPGGTYTLSSGSTFFTAVGSTMTVNGGATFLGTTALAGATNLNGATAVNGVMTFATVRRYRDPGRPADAATINVSVNDGDFILLATPAAARNVVVANATEGDQITIVQPPGVGTGLNFTVKRADATVIAELYGSDVDAGAGAVTQGGSVTLQVEAGVWRGMNYSGYIVAGAGW